MRHMAVCKAMGRVAAGNREKEFPREIGTGVKGVAKCNWNSRALSVIGMYQNQ